VLFILKKVFIHSFLILVSLSGLLLIGLFGYSFFNSYYPFSFEKTTGIVIHKEIEIGLSFFPKYYTTVLDENDGSFSQNKVSKRTMTSTLIGDRISGYKSEKQFFTTQQIVTDFLITLLFSIVGIILFLLGILVYIKNTRLYRSVQRWMKAIRIHKNFSKWIKYILLAGAIIYLFGGQFLHLCQIYLKQHNETLAEIVETEHKPGYGKYATSTYIFTLNYDIGGHESVEAKVKVSKDMYDSYQEGTTITVYYQEKNPYYTFLPSEINPKLKSVLTH